MWIPLQGDRVSVQQGFCCETDSVDPLGDRVSVQQGFCCETDSVDTPGRQSVSSTSVVN